MGLQTMVVLGSAVDPAVDPRPYVGRRGGAVPRPFIVRFAEKIDQAGGLFDCWPWQGGITDQGYGVMWDGTRLAYAHRLNFEMAGHVIPDGMELDHLCRNRACTNPAHLEPVPHRINVRRGLSGELRRRA